MCEKENQHCTDFLSTRAWPGKTFGFCYFAFCPHEHAQFVWCVMAENWRNHFRDWVWASPYWKKKFLDKYWTDRPSDPHLFPLIIFFFSSLLFFFCCFFTAAIEHWPEALVWIYALPSHHKMYAPYYNGYGNPYGYTPSPAPYMYGGGMNPYSYSPYSYGAYPYGGNGGYGYDYPYYQSRGLFRGLYGRRYMSPYSSYNYPMVGGYMPMYGSHGNRIYPETNYVSSVKDL